MHADAWLSLDREDQEEFLNEPELFQKGDPREVDCHHSSHDYDVDMERFACCDRRTCNCPCAPVPEG